MSDMERLNQEEDRVEMYQRLRSAANEDSLHALLVDKGAEILDLDFPYLLVAIRNRHRSTLRSDSSRRVREIRSKSIEDSLHSPDRLDPQYALQTSTDLDALLQKLAVLDESSLWLLWWSSAGHSSAEIAELWQRAGFEPNPISTANVRQRVSRARKTARKLIQTADE